MSSIESFIENSDKLTSVYGHWPSFHDAEVIELSLSRGDVNPEKDRYVFPVLTAKLHLWTLTNEVDSAGCLVCRNHRLVTLRFRDVCDDLRIEGFNHENAIFGLSIVQRLRDDGPSPVFAVTFEPSFGVGASFTCFAIEVVDVTPSDPEQ